VLQIHQKHINIALQKNIALRKHGGCRAGNLGSKTELEGSSGSLRGIRERRQSLSVAGREPSVGTAHWQPLSAAPDSRNAADLRFVRRIHGEADTGIGRSRSDGSGKFFGRVILCPSPRSSCRASGWTWRAEPLAFVRTNLCGPVGAAPWPPTR
jgi:hypothetical protein